MSSTVNKRNKGKRKARSMHPLDRDRLIMDSIYCSKSVEVQNCFRQVLREEYDTDRVHMRMGVRYFDMLSPTMQRYFLAEYPNAFIMFAGEATPTAASVMAEAV